MAFDLKDKVKLNTAQVNAIVSVALILFVIAICWQIFKARSSQIAQIKGETAKYIEKLEILHLVEIEEEKAQMLRERLGGFGARLELMNQINRITEKVGVEVDSIDYVDLREEKYIEIQPVQVQMTCTYHTLHSFITEIESTGPYMRIEQVDFSTQEAQGLAGRYSFGSGFTSPSARGGGLQDPQDSGPVQIRASVTIAGIRPKN